MLFVAVWGGRLGLMAGLLITLRVTTRGMDTPERGARRLAILPAAGVLSCLSGRSTEFSSQMSDTEFRIAQ